MPGKRLLPSEQQFVIKLKEYFEKERDNGGPLLPLTSIQEVRFCSSVHEVIGML